MVYMPAFEYAVSWVFWRIVAPTVILLVVLAVWDTRRQERKRERVCAAQYERARTVTDSLIVDGQCRR